MEIDWSKAPEWAVAHALYTFVNQITPVWVGVDQWQDVVRGKPFPYGGGAGDARHNPTRAQFQYETPRPAAWTGEGLPPVGTVCEVDGSAGPTGWGECTIRYVSDDVIVFKRVAYGFESFSSIGEDSFRPIRTPEQIAAEERIASAYRMCAIVPTLTNVDAVALYDAGYRKQPTDQ